MAAASAGQQREALPDAALLVDVIGTADDQVVGEPGDVEADLLGDPGDLQHVGEAGQTAEGRPPRSGS